MTTTCPPQPSPVDAAPPSRAAVSRRAGSPMRATGDDTARGAMARLRARVVRHGGSDRGDVPGWVLVTLMTAGLVVTLWAVAGPRLAEVFEDSLASVHGPAGP